MNFKNKSGITLIALIVTIIVLIIIAGISIATLTSDNGILRQTNSAKESQIEANVREQVELACSAMRLAIAEASAQDNSYSASANAGLIQSKLIDVLNADKTSLVGEFNNGGIAARENQRKITVVYDGEDYKNACNDELAVIKHTITLGQKTIQITSETSNTGEDVEKVIDVNPGVLETSSTGAHVINSIEDLVFFAYDVRNGNNYSGETVELGLSLDFNSEKSYVNALRTDYGAYGYDGPLATLLITGEGFKPIGAEEDSETSNFYGTFDAKGNSISNLYINVPKGSRIGLFTNNRGTVSNLQLLDVNLYLNNVTGGQAQAGGISAQNSRTGNITNCIVTGNIINEASENKVFTGGITTYSSGNIINCANFADIYSRGNYTGGICSQIEGNLNNSFNAGNIFPKCEYDTANVYVGGITGFGTPPGVISQCYNIGNVSSIVTGYSSVNNKIGGIVGTSNIMISDCYNIGNVSGSSAGVLYIGSLAGTASYTQFINSYYKENDNIKGIGDRNNIEGIAKTVDELTTDTFIDLLNTNVANAYKADTNNINNGYPILNWQ